MKKDSIPFGGAMKMKVAFCNGIGMGDVVENMHFISWRCFDRRRACLAKPG
jgi:hypothetical protein